VYRGQGEPAGIWYRLPVESPVRTLSDLFVPGG
jgi:hypothetical protein